MFPAVLKGTRVGDIDEDSAVSQAHGTTGSVQEQRETYFLLAIIKLKIDPQGKPQPNATKLTKDFQDKADRSHWNRETSSQIGSKITDLNNEVSWR